MQIVALVYVSLSELQTIDKKYTDEYFENYPNELEKVLHGLGMDTKNKSDAECAEFVITSIKRLSKTVEIPETLTELGITSPDLDLLAENSLKDACAFANPFLPTKEETIELFKKIL